MKSKPVRPTTVAPLCESRRNRLLPWLAGLLLVAAVVFAYQPAWNAGFIWDDDDYVTHNPLLTAPDGLQRIWFSLDSPSQYFPLVYTTFRVERALWGLNAAGFHWVNILLHAVNALLVWRLLARLKIPGAWLAAAIFALHPVNVESVAWITQLKNVQSLFFSLLALLAWAEFVTQTSRPAASRVSKSAVLFYPLSLLFYSLALFSKTTACTLPAALLLVLWLKHERIALRRFVQILPFIVIGVCMGLVSMWWERHHQGTVGEAYAMTLVERLLVASKAIWFYAGKLLWPSNLTFNYPLWKINPADPLAYSWLAAALIACGLIWFARRRLGRGVETATVFYVVTLSPLLGFIMLYTFRYTFVADHYQYVASIGPMALIAAAFVRVANLKSEASTRYSGMKNFAASAFCGAMLLSLATLTWRQARMYENLQTLWETTIERNPKSFMAHNNLGAIYLAQGRTDDAIFHFLTALEIQPHHANAHGNLANALLRLGRTTEALDHFQRAAEIQPDAKSFSDLGFGLLQKGRADDAIAACRKALEIQPDFAEAHNNLGLSFQRLGMLAAAVTNFQNAVKARPDFTQARYNLALALFQNGQITDAVAQLRTILKTQPDNAELQNNLGWALLKCGQADEAIAHFQTALKLQPDFAAVHNNLAIAFLQTGRAREAVAEYESFLQLQPDDPQVLAELAWVLSTCPDAAVRDGAKAVELARRAEKLCEGKDARVIQSLAAALAERGQFTEAAVTAQRAAELADARSDSALADGLRTQMKTYQSGTPFRDTSVTISCEQQVSSTATP